MNKTIEDKIAKHEERINSLELEVQLLNNKVQEIYNLLVKIKNRLFWFTGLIIGVISGTKIF